MSKSREILEAIRTVKEAKEVEFLSHTTGWTKRAPIFEPVTDKEALAWRVGFMRGMEQAEFVASEILYPTIDTDND